MPITPLAREILDFWFVPASGETIGTGNATVEGVAVRNVWFRKDDAFDAAIRERFAVPLAAGLAGAYGEWCDEPRGSLARVVLLDQFTRNAFRGTPQAFAGDARALATTKDALDHGYDDALRPQECWFLYMPLEHSEALADQDRAVALFEALAAKTGLDEPLPWAIRHRDVIRRFGRFPHRNAILDRTSTAEERAFLREPGSSF
jgi:uncharacterized protein (DUF924 family)